MLRQGHKTQAPNLCKLLFTGVLLLTIGFGMSACGKKASRLDPPDGIENDVFPLTYPDIKTDPQGTVGPRPDLAPKPVPQPPH